MPNVTLQPNTITDLYAESGITPGTQINVYNNSANPVKLGTTAASLQTDGDFRYLPGYASATNEVSDTEARALSVGLALVNVREVV